MPGSDVIATGTSDPLFFQKKMAALGDTIGGFVQAHRQRKAQADAQAQAEIENAFKLMAQYPELADSWGESLKAKYGESHPEVAGLVDVVKNRRTLAEEIPAAGRKWEGAWGDLESRHAADQQALQAMPDWTQVSAPMSLATSPIFSNAAQPPAPPLRAAVGSNAVPELSPYMAGPGPQAPLKAAQDVTLTLPNAEKLAAGKRLAQVNPDMFPVQAMGKLTPAERLNANVYAKSKGYDVPDTTVLDRLKMLPEKARAQEMLRLGMIPGGSDTADVIAYENKLKVAPATQEAFDHEDRMQGVKHENRIDEMDHSDEQQTARLTYAESLRTAAHNRTVAGQKEIIDYRESKRPLKDDAADDGVSWRTMVNDSKVATRDWDQRANIAVKGLTGKERLVAKDAFERETGPRPVPVPEVVARQIERQITDRGLTGSEAAEAAIAATSTYMAEKKRGASMSDAAKRATGMVSPEARSTKIDFSSIRDEAARRAAVADYAARLKAGTAPPNAFREALAAAEKKAPAPASPTPLPPAKTAPPPHGGPAGGEATPPVNAKKVYSEPSGKAEEPKAMGMTQTQLRKGFEDRYPIGTTFKGKKVTSAWLDIMVADFLREHAGK